ncbi:MAG: hypothetical protein VX738_12955 [Planctomycetota bacterium]|nr:hypothetical protein [Planctomycetota bacterium]
MQTTERPSLDLRPPGPGAIQRWLRGAAITVVVLVSVIVVNQAWIDRQLNEQIRLRIETAIAAQYPELTVTVGSAQRTGNHGVRLEDVEISLAAVDVNPWQHSSWDTATVVEIQRLDLIGPTDYATLLKQQPVIQQVNLVQGRIHVIRDRHGQWNVVELIKRLQNSLNSQSVGSLPTIRLNQLELAIRDENQVATQPLSVMLQDTVIAEQEREHVTDSAAPENGLPNHGRVLAIRSDATNSFVRSISIRGAVSLDSQPSVLAIELNSLKLTNELFEFLPLQVLDEFPAGMEVRGDLNLALQLQTQMLSSGSEAEDRPVGIQSSWIAAGVMVNGFYRDRRLPYPITDISSSMTWQNDVLKLEKIRGSLGSTPVKAHARITQFGLQPIVDIGLAIDKILIDEALLMGLREDGPLSDVRKALHTYSPRGTAAITYRYDNVGEQPRSDLNLQLLDMDITYAAFPYTLKNAQGTVRIQDGDVLVEEIQAHSHGRTFRINADIKAVKDHPQGWLEITSDGPVPLDAELIGAMAPATRKTMDLLRPTGMISLHRARYQFNGEKTNPYRNLEFDIHQGTLFYKKFPYPIQRIHGHVRAEGKDWSFEDFSGYKGSAFIQMRGRLDETRTTDAPLQLIITATDVALDNDLRDALAATNDSTLQTWRELNPQGALDQVRISLESTLQPDGTHVLVHGKKWVPTDSLTTSTLQFMPQWLPYPIRGITGEFILQDGHVRLTGIDGTHGDTKFSLDGVYNRTAKGHWNLALDHFNVQRLSLDADLMAALPSKLSKTLRKLDVAGHFQLDGDLYFSHDPRSIKPVHASWNMQLDTAGAAISHEPRISGIYGGAQFTGVYDDRGFRTNVTLDVESMFWGRQQITKVSGPLWIDEKQLLAGSWARTGPVAQRPSDQSVIRQPQRPIHSLTAQSFGGRAQLDLQIRFPETAREAAALTGVGIRPEGQPGPSFMLQGSLLQADLAQIARYRGVQEKTSGRLNAGLRMRGLVDNRASWIGDGTIRLDRADTYQLPLMVVLFNKIDPQDEQGVFSSTEVDFRVRSQQVVLDRIDLRGDAVSLFGTGWMSFDEEINLNFYSRVGRQQLALPLLNTVLSEASKSLLKIEVVGSVSQPRVNGTAFPELDDTMERILKNLEPRIASPLRDDGRNGILQLR